MPAPDVIPTLIETERLLIRAIDPRYAAALHEAVTETFEELHRWMPWAQSLGTLEQQHARMTEAAAQYARGEDLGMLLFRRTDDVLLGASGLHRINWHVPRMEIGYWRRAGCGGQGYVTEAVRGIAEFAFAELAAQRVEIWVSSRNLPSQRVAERAGFQREAELRQDRRDPTGELANSIIYGRTP